MKKSPAADRTVDMFTKTVSVTPIEERTIEQEEASTHTGDRKPLEDDHERQRAIAFQGQEWTSKYFGSFDAPGNEYRVSHKGEHYYLETLAKLPDGKEAYGYTGVMVHDRDLYKMVEVLVRAVRDKQAREKAHAPTT